MPLFSRIADPAQPPWRGALLVAAAAFALYLPSLGGGFAYDSVLQVGLDDFIHQQANWADVLTFRVIAQDELDRNRPVQLASLMLDAAVWGRNPFGYRLTSALLHAATAALLYLVALRVMVARTRPGDWAALAGALFFAWHPLCVETVCEPSNREDVLAGFFLLLGLVIFLRPPTPSLARAWGRGAVIVVCSVLAAGSKEVGWIAPLVLAAAWWFVVRPARGCARVDVAILSAVAFSVALLAAAILFLKPPQSDVFLFVPEPWSWSQWADRQSEIQAAQVERLVFPLRLCADYYRDNLAPWTLPWWWLLPLGLAAATVVWVWRYASARVGLVLFGAALVPSANLLGQFNPLADRFLYLPLAGLALALIPPLASGFARLRRAAAQRVAAAAVLVVLALLAARSLAYQRVWDNERDLWDATLAANPRSWNALLGSGAVRFEAGEISAAGPYWSEMLRREPRNGVALLLSALLAEAQGRPREADLLYAQAVQIDPALADPDRYARYYGWRPRLRAVLDSLRARAEF